MTSSEARWRHTEPIHHAEETASDVCVFSEVVIPMEYLSKALFESGLRFLAASFCRSRRDMGVLNMYGWKGCSKSEVFRILARLEGEKGHLDADAPG